MEDSPGNDDLGVIVRRNRFAESTKSLYLNEKTADFWFLFGSGVNQIRIPVHKAMLAKESEVFSAMFYGEMKEENNEVVIVDANGDEFTEFVQFFYTDKTTITMKNLPALMYLATKYMIIELLMICEKFIIEHLPIEKFLWGCDLAMLFDRFQLKGKLERKISENAKQFLATNEFRECSRDSLKIVLAIDQLMCDPQDVFNACIEWAKNACENNENDLSEMENIRKELGECLYSIPFYSMSSEQILQIVNDYEELFDRSEIVELMNMMTLSGRTKVTKFKCNHFAPYEKSNWKLWWRLGSDKLKRWIRKQEIVYLTYRNRNILKAIQPFFIWNTGKTNCSRTLTGVMQVVEKATTESDENVRLKQPISITCRDHQICISMPTIRFAKPVIFEPYKTYKIVLDFDDSWSEKTFFTLKVHTSMPEDLLPLICYDTLSTD